MGSIWELWDDYVNIQLIASSMQALHCEITIRAMQINVQIVQISYLIPQ